MGVPGSPGTLREKKKRIVPMLSLQQLRKLCQDAQTKAAGTVL